MDQFGLQAQETRGVVTPSFVESMVCRLLASPLLFEEVQGLLDPRHFIHQDEQHFVVLLRAMTEVYQQYHQFDYETLRAAIETILCDFDLPAVLRAHLLDDPDGLLAWALVRARPQIAATPAEQSRAMLRRFLQERSVFAPLQQVFQNGMPADFHTVIDGATQQWQRIEQIDSDPISAAVPDGSGSKPLVVRSTGVPYLDLYMDGGHADGEAYGLLGPTGGGKTTLACEIAGASAQSQRDLADATPGTQPQLTYYVTYEAGRDEIKQRIVSGIADISRSSIKELDFGAAGPPASFTTARAQNYKEYELSATANPGAGEIRAGELERYNNAVPILNCLRIVDLSGTGDMKHCRPGEGGVAEIVGLIAKDQARMGNPGVALVVIDYVLLAVERFLRANNRDITKHVRFEIAGFADNARTQIGGRFKSPVWLCHQLNTTANKKSAVATNSHNDAAEAGNRFAQNLSFCATLGTKDEKTHCVLLTFSKRRRAGEYHAARVLQFDPVFHRMRDVSDTYAASPTTGRIESLQLMRAVHGAPQPTAAPTHHDESAIIL